MQQPKFLSASGIESFDKCSWMFYCSNILKIPRTEHEGALRGTVAHSIFELLLYSKHKKHYDSIVKEQSVSASKAVDRLLIQYLKKYHIYNEVNYDLMDKMILVGLNYDFFGDGDPAKIKIGEPEYWFELENENPKYKIRGLMDKRIFYAGDKIKIVDYKSSKNRFTLENLSSNIQAMTYSLAAYKLLNAKDVTVEFMFLRFPKQPVQICKPSLKQLNGFEHYLAYMYEIVNKFDEDAACSNMAAYSIQNRWLCKNKSGTWVCPYLKAFDYWQLCDKDEKIIKTSLKDDLIPGPEQHVIELRYNGCIAHNNLTHNQL